MPNMKRENNIAQTAAEFNGFSKETIAKFNEIKKNKQVPLLECCI